MDNEINEMIKDINRLIEISQYYFYDKKYTDHKSNIKKLKKKLKRGEIEDCAKKGCELY